MWTRSDAGYEQIFKRNWLRLPSWSTSEEISHLAKPNICAPTFLINLKGIELKVVIIQWQFSLVIETFSQRQSDTALLDINHIHSAVIDPNFTLEFSSDLDCMPQNIFYQKCFRHQQTVRWVVATFLLPLTPPSTSASSSPASSPSSSPPSSMPSPGQVVESGPSSTPQWEISLINLSCSLLRQVRHISVDWPAITFSHSI